MQERAARAPVAVREGVGGLELRMEDGGFRHRRDVLPYAERNQVIQARPHPACMRGHERCAVRAVRRSAYPHLLVAEAHGIARSPHKSVMDGAEGVDANATALAERFHLAFSGFLSKWNSYVLMG